METNLKNKVVLITGAAGGIGSEMVKSFAKENCKLVIHYRNSKENAEKLASELPKNSYTLIQADLSSEKDVISLFSQAEKELGPIEVCILNAGIWVEKDTPIYEMSLEQWNYTISTNLTSMFLCLREFFKGIKKHQMEAPSAVLIGSTAGIYGESGHSDYAASKAGAVYGFMLSLKNELTKIALRGRINAICPSWVLSPMVESFAEDKKAVTRVLQTVALRKVGRPNDVANASVFLASSNLSGHMSGQIMTLAGGMEGRVLYEPSEINLDRA
jgi:3-oxoacyl-[acyl-carrier protein] reductase